MAKNRKLTKDSFLEKVATIHHHFNDFDFSDSVYLGCCKPFEYRCPKHGKIKVSKARNLYTYLGCSECTLDRKQEEFINKSTEVHGGKYCYDKVEYVHSKKKVCITCPKHGDFWQIPNGHLLGRCCWGCSYDARSSNTQEFTEKAKEVHGDLYDYSKSEYTGSGKHIEIVCKKHGTFKQSPHSHLKGYGCNKCGGAFLDTDLCIEKFEEIYGSKFQYSDLDYEGPESLVTIKCNSCLGIYSQKVKHHMTRGVCQICLDGCRDLDNYINTCNEIHENKYEYTKTSFRKLSDIVIVTCPEHGDFQQLASSHKRGFGCVKCSGYSKGEKLVEKYLLDKGINYVCQKGFEGLR